jgi:hypothetical protein
VKFSRVIAGVVLALFVAASSTACTTHAGAAAQVGSQTIETSSLRGIVDRGLVAVKSVPAEQAARTLDRAELQRRALTILVQQKLLAAEAERRHITVDEQDVDAYYHAYGILEFGSVAAFEMRAAAVGFATEDIRIIMHSGALEQAIQDDIAPGLVADDATVQAQYDSIRNQLEQRGQLGEAGEIPLTLEQARPYLERSLVGEQRAEKMRPFLVKTAEREGVAVNPRFGKWDPEQFAVVAAEGTIATTVAPAPPFDPTVVS